MSDENHTLYIASKYFKSLNLLRFKVSVLSELLKHFYRCLCIAKINSEHFSLQQFKQKFRF